MTDRPARLADMGDVLRIKDICRVLQISRRELYRLRQHGIFPAPIDHLAHRWTRAAVERFVQGQSVKVLRRA